jgi:hypothetical protein
MLTVNEQCSYCGARAAWHEGDTILVSHHCDKGPPGPADPPRRLPIDQVNFLRGEFTHGQYRDELDAAFTALKVLREQRLDLSDRLRIIKTALKGHKDWRE